MESPHLSSTHSCSWPHRSPGDLATALAGGHRATLAIRLQASILGAASTFSISSRHLPWAFWPLLNLDVCTLGSAASEQKGWCGPRGSASSVRGSSPPRDVCKPGPPRSQGARRTSQEESQRDPKPSPSTSKVRPKTPGRRSHGCQSIRPAQGGRQERGPKWPARPGSGPRGAGEGRCGRHP